MIEAGACYHRPRSSATRMDGRRSSCPHDRRKFDLVFISSASRAHSSRALSALLALVALATLGCGYALVGRASNIPEDIQRVYVTPFENRTTRSEIEQFITAEVINELVTRQRFTMVNGTDEADAVIVGVISGFRVTPITFDADGRASEYEATITADVAFRRVPTEPGAEAEVIWANSRYLFRETYELDASDEFFDQENIALDDTAELFAKTMVSDLLEGF